MMPAGRHVMVEGLRVFVREEGEGPPVVLVHGYAVSHLEWRQVIPRLAAAGRRAIALDLPACGESDAPSDYPYGIARLADTVAALIDALGVGPAPVVGHSMGGAVALHVALRHPAAVERLVLVDAALYPGPIPIEGRIPLLPVVGRLLFRHAYGAGQFRGYFRKWVYRDAASLDEDLVRYYYACFRRARDPQYALLREVTDLGRFSDLPPHVRHVTRILWGEEDRIFPLPLGRRLAAEIPGATLDIVPACGHAPNEERPDLFARMLLDALAHHAPAAAG